jgi:hypothetical protein
MQRPESQPRCRPTLCGLISALTILSAIFAIVVSTYRVLDLPLLILSIAIIVANLSTITVKDWKWRFLVFAADIFGMGMLAYYLYRREPDGRNKIFTIF